MEIDFLYVTSKQQRMNFRQTLANASSNAYLAVSDRPGIGSWSYQDQISGPRTAVYNDGSRTIVAHRGTVWTDPQDVYNDGRIAVGMPVGDKRISTAHEVSRKAKALGNPIHHTGHSLGGATSRRVARERGESNTTFNRYTGLRPNAANRMATLKCKQGGQEPHCFNTEDVYNPQDVAALRVKADYGRKTPQAPTDEYKVLKRGPVAAHSVQQFTGKGKGKKIHPQQKLMDLALKYA